MSSGAIFMIVVAAAFPGIIILAVVVKLWEVRQASRWPSTNGKVIASSVQAHKNKPGDMAYDFSDTEVRNEPLVEYEYQVGNRKYKCSRITIGEKTSAFELESILERYQIGTPVTVYYNPTDPTKAVLERDLPTGVLLLGVGCLLLFFIGGPLLAAAYYFGALAWLKTHLHDPSRAPFVAALGGFGILTALFSFAFWRHVCQTANWPTTRGVIVASGVEEFLSKEPAEGYYRRQTYHKSSVLYSYEVNGRKFHGDRLTIGVVISATLPGFARQVAARYPVGKEVEVYYNPQSPGESVLQPKSALHLLLWIVTAGIFYLVWAVATGKM